MVTSYNKVKKVTSGYVKYYKEDITHHDRKALNRYTGNFIYGMRESGTNLIKEVNLKSMTLEQFGLAETFLLGNKRFFIQHSGKFKEINKREVVSKLQEYKKKVAWKNVNDVSLLNIKNGNFIEISKNLRNYSFLIIVKDKRYYKLESNEFKTYKEAKNYMYSIVNKYS